MQTQDWNKRYRERDTPWDFNRPSPVLRQFLETGRIPTGRVLEYGCGTGNNAILLAQRGFDVAAVDCSPLALEKAKAKAAAAKVSCRFLLGDLFDLPDLGGPFDFVFDRACFHTFPAEGRSVLASITWDRLRHHGLFLFLAGNSNERSKNGPPRISASEILLATESCFELVELSEFRFDGDKPDDHPLGWVCLLRGRAERGDLARPKNRNPN